MTPSLYASAIMLLIPVVVLWCKTRDGKSASFKQRRDISTLGPKKGRECKVHAFHPEACGVRECRKDHEAAVCRGDEYAIISWSCNRTSAGFELPRLQSVSRWSLKPLQCDAVLALRRSRSCSDKRRGLAAGPQSCRCGRSTLGNVQRSLQTT